MFISCFYCHGIGCTCRVRPFDSKSWQNWQLMSCTRRHGWKRTPLETKLIPMGPRLRMHPHAMTLSEHVIFLSKSHPLHFAVSLLLSFKNRSCFCCSLGSFGIAAHSPDFSRKISPSPKSRRSSVRMPPGGLTCQAFCGGLVAKQNSCKRIPQTGNTNKEGTSSDRMRSWYTPSFNTPFHKLVSLQSSNSRLFNTYQTEGLV